ncbi:MAG: excalibur calcium-binding domain-containing protein [Gordonia sp. (in: high G+C Gram-positive bacteria)]|nr:excalibur calcium-binding domain-containing protein [Gordonia sp. (in: high G+C Gram-positive bacteria)]
MTNPFANPFDPSNTGGGGFNPPPPTPPVPPPPAPGPSEPNRPGTAAKIGGWVLLVLGAIGVLASFTAWSEPMQAIGQLLFWGAVGFLGSTLIWRRWPWKIGGPVAGGLIVVSFVLIGLAGPADKTPTPAPLLDTSSSSTAVSTTTTTATSTVVSSTTVTVTAETSSTAPAEATTAEPDVDVDTRAPRRTTPVYTPPTTEDTGAAYYPNCAAVRAAGKAPLYQGQPGYSTDLDRDRDGVACDGG